MPLHLYCSRQTEENQNNNAQARNVDTSNGMKHGFSFFKKFDKEVNTFFNARDMHAFPAIQNKIQVEDDNNDIFIGNKFDSVLESVRKEANDMA